MRSPVTRDDGTITLLTIGLMTVVLMVLAGLSQAGHLFLAQRTLAADCDSAAIAAVQPLDVDELYSGHTRIDLADARRAAGPLATAVTVSPDGRGVSLVCERRVSVPFTRVVGIGPTMLRAHAAARLPP